MAEAIEGEATMLCVYCGAPWTDDMVQVYDIDVCGGCDTCGYGASTSGTVEIRCESCKRLIYKKEFNSSRG